MELTNEPILSIIVPIYNGEAYIDDLSACIAAQTFSEKELILVDDGSTDHTLIHCRELEKQHSWIQVIHTENKGVSHARNTGLKLARGRWIHFVDADDRIMEGMYCEFAETAAANDSDVIICGCKRVRMETGESIFCGPDITRTFNKEETLELFDRMEMGTRYWLLDYIWNKWYRRDLIEKYEIHFPESLSLGEDFVFNTRYFQHVTGVSLISRCYYQYLIRENGLVSQFRENPWEIRQKLYDAQVELYQSLGLFRSNQEYLQLQAGQIAFGDIRTINAARCRYGIKQKIKFVDSMLKSSQYPWMMEYLKVRGEKSIVFRLYSQLFSIRRSDFITFVISLENIFYNFLKRR